MEMEYILTVLGNLYSGRVKIKENDFIMRKLVI